jgi:hypothetical protein
MMLRFPWVAVAMAPIALAAFASCDARRDSEGGSDASSDVGSDASADVGSDVGSDAGSTTCPSVASLCAGDAAPVGFAGDCRFTYHCVSDWKSGTDPSSWCSCDPAVFRLPNCGGYNVILDENVDVAYAYAFDVDSGALVGIQGLGMNGVNGGPRCIAGTSFDVSTCAQATSLHGSLCWTPPDGGPD